MLRSKIAFGVSEDRYPQLFLWATCHDCTRLMPTRRP